MVVTINREAGEQILVLVEKKGGDWGIKETSRFVCRWFEAEA